MTESRLLGDRGSSITRVVLKVRERQPAERRTQQQAEAAQQRKAIRAKTLRKKRPWWWRLIRLCFFGYAAILVALLLLENRLIYPGAYFAAENVAAASENDIQTVRYQSTAQNELPGRQLLRPDADRWILFFHGNGIRARQLDSWLRQLSASANANVFAVEYRGYEDDQPPSESGLILDGIAAVDHVAKVHSVSPDQMIFYGRSLGGGVAAGVAFDRRPAAMVLERTFDAAVNVAADRFWFVPVSVLMRNRFDSAARISVYDGPVVVVGGLDDRVIPIQSVRALHRAASRADATLIEVPRLGHNDPMPENVMSQILDAIPAFSNPSHPFSNPSPSRELQDAAERVENRQ